MRPLAVLMGLTLLLVAAVPLAARDGEASSRPITDPDRRARLKYNLARFRRLSVQDRDRVRGLDRTLHDEEDAATRARLWAVMERYAGWLSRLPKDEREKIEAAQPGPERIAAVRSMLKRQWLNGLPAAYRKQLAGTPVDQQPALLEKWRADERTRRRDRLEALRRLEEGLFNEKFQQDVYKYVKEVLEPKLTPRERKQLAETPRTQRYNYFHKVWALSRNHDLTPPGPSEMWLQVQRRGRPPEQQK
jgi:hypothetical protein